MAGDIVAYIYIIRCEDNSLYTGIAKDIKARMKEHINATAAKYTSSHRIKQLCALWECESYRDAARLEYAIKTLTKSKKEALVLSPESVNGYFQKLENIHYEIKKTFDIWTECDG
ncbi:MAG: GIY-YIG nuclease family protein [Clostridia bacterium]|nr:GIY-YIG nuclease family protein [Clostridia bacterium]